jgi:hypothetical protein
LVLGDPTEPEWELLTILVGDPEKCVAALAERAPLASMDTLPGVVRKGDIADLEGNRIAFGENFGSDE